MKNKKINEHTSAGGTKQQDQQKKTTSTPIESEDKKISAFSIKLGDENESNEQAIQLEND